MGVGRGDSFMKGAEHAGMELVAICDTWEEKLNEAGKRYGVATYTSFDEFITHDMDAVVLANYVHDHAPFAVRALDAGLHVMSECIAARTMGQCVELCEAVERSDRIYMFAENYPYMLACQEMRRLYMDGEIGDVRYAEGEYNHPCDEDVRLGISPGVNHWRNWLPPTYYVNHALAPLMYMTDTMPVSLNALSITEPRTQAPNTTKISDVGSIVLCRMQNGSVFRIWGLMLSSIHRVRYELHGERGLIGTAPEPNHTSHVRVHHEKWLGREGEELDRTYRPDWPEHGDLADHAGHGGGDFWTSFHFANAIRSSEQPYLNVYRATAMAAVSILGWRSCLENGAHFAIPDFSSKAERQAFADDHWSPFPEDAAPGQPPVSLQGNLEPNEEVVAYARDKWAEQGYDGP